MLRFAIYVSNHGYGHASRVAALAKEFNKFGIWTEIRTNRPAFLFSDLDQSYSRISLAELDFGVIHAEGLKTDLIRTEESLLQLLSRRSEIVQREVSFLREEQIDCVVSDIPFLICEAAAYANLPVLALSNFDWYFIYSELFRAKPNLKPVLNTIYGIYSKVKLAYRVPFSDAASMVAFPKAKEMGILARKKDSYRDIRGLHHLDAKLPIALSSHGGEGEIDLGLESFLKVWPGYLISSSASLEASNHLRIEKDADFLDYLKAADILITKPGYSSLAEAVQAGKTILYKQRLNYPEERVLVGGLSGYPMAKDLGQTKLTKSTWKALLGSLPEPGKKRIPVRYRNANNVIAAQMVSDFLKLGKRGELISVFDMGSNNLNFCLYDCSSEKPVHETQLPVGLAKGLKKGFLTKAAIHRANRALQQLNEFDCSIDSSKVLIGTAACRAAKNLDELQARIHQDIGLTLKVINSKDEANFAFQSARPHLLVDESSVVIDIGGYSTELVLSKGKRKYGSRSLPLGLLDLYQNNREEEQRLNRIREQLATLEFSVPDRIITVGLTGAFLLKVLRKSLSYIHSNELLKITRDQLLHLLQVLDTDSSGEYEAYLPEPANKEILAVSAHFMIEVLDRFEQNQILVCTDGIALGYARHISNKTKRKI